MIPLAALKLVPWRLVGYAAAAGAVVWLIWAQIDNYGDRRATRAANAVRADWDAQVAAATKVAQDAETARIASESATAARNAEMEKARAKESARLAADNSRLERLLTNALAPRPAPGGGGNPEVAGLPGTAPAGTPGSDEPPAAAVGIAADIAAALTEARLNAEQLDALIAQIRPQL